MVPEFLADPHVAALRRRVDVVYDPDLHSDLGGLFDAIAEASAVVIRNRTQVNAGFLAAAPKLVAVGRLGVGLDNVDLNAIAKANVEVFVARNANTVPVAEYVIGAVFALTRRVFSMKDALLAGSWPRQGSAFGQEMDGKTLGLIGFGAIGRAVAGRAQGLGMHIVANDPILDAGDPAWESVDRADFASVLERSDVVSLHVPLGPSTRHLMDADAFDRMRQGAFLINTARGAVVDDHALVAALRSGKLAGAALDVFAEEPLDPGLRELFSGIDNLIITPHIAGNTVESAERVAMTTIDAVLDRLSRPDGEPPSPDL